MFWDLFVGTDILNGPNAVLSMVLCPTGAAPGIFLPTHCTQDSILRLLGLRKSFLIQTITEETSRPDQCSWLHLAVWTRMNISLGWWESRVVIQAVLSLKWHCATPSFAGYKHLQAGKGISSSWKMKQCEEVSSLVLKVLVGSAPFGCVVEYRWYHPSDSTQLRISFRTIEMSCSYHQGNRKQRS